jgi:phosphoglycolate phosphatase-like HAD superfamily hydrolase
VDVLIPVLREKYGMDEIDSGSVLVVGDTVADVQFARNIKSGFRFAPGVLSPMIKSSGTQPSIPFRSKAVFTAAILREKYGMDEIDSGSVLVVGDTVADVQFARNIKSRPGCLITDDQIFRHAAIHTIPLQGRFHCSYTLITHNRDGDLVGV